MHLDVIVIVHHSDWVIPKHQRHQARARDPGGGCQTNPVGHLDGVVRGGEVSDLVLVVQRAIGATCEHVIPVVWVVDHGGLPVERAPCTILRLQTRRPDET